MSPRPFRNHCRGVAVLPRVALPVLLAWSSLPGPVAAEDAEISIPLVEGLTVVTAIADRRGDFETLKQVVALDDANVTLAYRADVPGGNTIEAVRPVLREDLATADIYRNFFTSGDQKSYPGTTAVGPSLAIMNALAGAGESEIAVYVGLGRAYRGQRGALVKTGMTTVPVLVNGKQRDLPAVQAEANFDRATAEFWFYPHPQQPLTLRYKFREKEAEQFANLPPEMLAKLREQQPLREESMQVVKIEYPGEEADGEPGGSQLETQLESEGRAEVYGIYFDFDSDRLKPESDAVLERIAGVLSRHPEWALSIEGHTDNVGADDYNLELSQRRAAAVKRALVARYGVDGERLDTTGHGAARPKADNDTLEGRAMNRRVELVRGV